MSVEHKKHSYCEATSLVDKSVASVEESMVILEDRERGLVNAMKTISDNVTIVKDEMANSMRDIEVIFAKIHEDLEHREHSLLQRLHDISNRKTSILNEQLQEMDNALEKCRHALAVSGDLLEKSVESVVKGGGLYVVGLADPIASRRDELDELIVNIPFEPQVDPYIRASFINDEIETVHSVLLSLGSILTKDNTPAVDDLESRSPRRDDDDDDDDDVVGEEKKIDLRREKDKPREGNSKIVDKKGRFTYSALSKSPVRTNSSPDFPFKVSFTIRTE